MYSQHTVTAMADIPVHVGNFASSLGWNTDLTDPNAPEIWHPTLVGAAHFTFTASGNDCVITRVGVSPARKTISRAPDEMNVRATPTRVHLIGMLTPEPYIAVVIEFGFNLFRHMYIGNMEKIGNYTGGEVYSSNQQLVEGSGYFSHRNFVTSGTKWLFSAYGTPHPAGSRGEVHVEHADNPNSWREFSDFPISTTPIDAMGETLAFGGFQDKTMANAYVDAAHSDYAGAVVLVPIELYAPIDVAGDIRVVPIGNPSGVRHLNIENLDVGAQVQVGGETWYTFPVFSKQSDPVMGKHGSSTLANESSYFVGHAYRGA